MISISRQELFAHIAPVVLWIRYTERCQSALFVFWGFTVATIKPSNINARSWINGAFASPAMDRAATWVVRFYQERPGDSWQPFSLAAIDGFYAPRNSGRAFDFAGLVADGFVTGGGASFVPTAEFIRRCYRASPA